MEQARVSLFQGPNQCQVARDVCKALPCPSVVGYACWVVGHWERCHFPLYFLTERLSVLVSSATLLYIFGSQNPLKPSYLVFGFVMGSEQLPLCKILTGMILERLALIKLGACSGQDHVPLHSSVDMAGKESVIVSDDLACSAECQECPMFSQGGVLSTTNGQQSVMMG